MDDTNNLIKPPFTRTKLDEEKLEEKRVILTVSMNKSEEYPKVVEMMQLLNVSNDSTVIKMVFEIGYNVLLTTFNAENLKYLTSAKRKRLNE